MALFRKWLANEDGATLIEYSLIVALLSAALIGILFTVGSDLVNVFQKISTDVKG